MRRLLIIGASLLQLPAIQKAKKMGIYVGVVDYNPQAIGISYADMYYNVSTVDEIGVYEAAKTFKADGIMTLATDMPMRSVAYTCEKLNLTGITYDTAIKATDKGAMIKAFELHGVAHPWYYIINSTENVDALNDIIFPCITKPTDNSGSRGVMLVKNVDELKAAIEYSFSEGRSGSVIIEEYMRGPEVSVEMMVVDGEPHILQITDKLTTGAPHFVEMGHSQPSKLSKDAQNAIRSLAAKSALAVGIENGPAHVEIILTKDGPKMVELGARMGGDCITTHLVPLSTGIDMVRATIILALGGKPDIEQKYSKGCAIRYFNAPYGKIKSITGVEEAKQLDGATAITIVKNVGDVSGEIGSSADRIGFVIAQKESVDEAIHTCEDAIKRIDIITEV